VKTRWQFFFECEDIRFERAHEFEAVVTSEHAVAFGLPAEEFVARIKFEPDKESYVPTAEQTGQLHIIVPGNNEQTKALAFWLAVNAAEQISFSQGKIKIAYGLILGEHLPDSRDEEEQLGEARYFAEAHLVEARPPRVFDGDKLQRVSTNPLMGQFNRANSAQNPIDRYLGLFRIIEALYGATNKRSTLAKTLKASDELFRIAKKHIYITQGGESEELKLDDYHRIIDKLVKTRHECAHLVNKDNFGITHVDSRVKKEVEPLANMIKNVVYEAVQSAA
jgi:hypothetical protein